MRDDPKVLYCERPGNIRLWLGVPLLCVAAYFGWDMWWAWPLDKDDVVAFAVVVPMFTGLAVIVGAASIGKRRYSSVTVTPTVLRVGRDTLPLAVIDATALKRISSAEPSIRRASRRL